MVSAGPSRPSLPARRHVKPSSSSDVKVGDCPTLWSGEPLDGKCRCAPPPPGRWHGGEGRGVSVDYTEGEGGFARWEKKTAHGMMFCIVARWRILGRRRRRRALLSGDAKSPCTDKPGTSSSCARAERPVPKGAIASCSNHWRACVVRASTVPKYGTGFLSLSNVGTCPEFQETAR